MKHLKLTTICLGIAMIALVVSEAEAGLFGKSRKKKRTEKTEEMKQPARYDNYPTMKFVGGTLSRSSHSGWKIGEIPLYVHKECVITVGGSEEGWLEEGSRATVMGNMVGGAINAYSIYISPPPYMSMNGGMGALEDVKEAGPNPDVGKILIPVE